jgi:hypothetical protein
MLYKHHCRSSPYFTKQSLYYLPPMSRWQNQNSSQGLSLLPLYHFTPLFIYLTIRVTEGLFSILFSPLVLVLFEPKSWYQFLMVLWRKLKGAALPCGKLPSPVALPKWSCHRDIMLSWLKISVKNGFSDWQWHQLGREQGNNYSVMDYTGALRSCSCQALLHSGKLHAKQPSLLWATILWPHTSLVYGIADFPWAKKKKKKDHTESLSELAKNSKG